MHCRVDSQNDTVRDAAMAKAIPASEDGNNTKDEPLNVGNDENPVLMATEVAFWPKSLLPFVRLEEDDNSDDPQNDDPQNDDPQNDRDIPSLLTLSPKESDAVDPPSSSFVSSRQRDDHHCLLLIGWRSSTRTMTSTQSSHHDNNTRPQVDKVTTVVVAAVVVDVSEQQQQQQQRQDDEEKEQHARVQQALDQWNQTMMNQSHQTKKKNSIHDDRSTRCQYWNRERALCWEPGLQILGMLKKGTRNRNTNHDLSQEEQLVQQFPWTASSSNDCRGQLVIYEDSMDDAYYYHNEQKHNPPDWLLRIDNAPMVQLELGCSGLFDSKGRPQPQQQFLSLDDNTAHLRTDSPTRNGEAVMVSQFLHVLGRQHHRSWPLPRRIAAMFWLAVTGKPIANKIRDDNIITQMTKQEYISRQVKNIESNLVDWWNLVLGVVVVIMALIGLVVWMQRHNSNLSSDYSTQQQQENPLGSPLEAAIFLWGHALKWHFDKLRFILSWLCQNPVGIKVNAPLANTMSGYATELIHRVESIWMALLRHLGEAIPTVLPNNISTVIQCMACLMLPLLTGISGLLALASDIGSLTLWHVSAIADALHVVIQGEWYILEATWRMFRGKKRNVLRHDRTDTLHYDSTQLLFGGSILFAIALFLGSTLFIYFAVWTLIRNVLVTLVQAGLQRLLAQFEATFYLDLEGSVDGTTEQFDRPFSLFGSLAKWYIRWFQRKRWFPKSTYLVPVAIGQSQSDSSTKNGMLVDATYLETSG